MAAFAYTVIDKEGNRKVGVITAEKMDDAVKKLQNEFATIISVKPSSKVELSQESFTKRLARTYKKIREGVPAQSVVFFTRQLATMFSAGMTIEKAISNLSKSEKHLRFKKILTEIQTDIRSGVTLSEACAKHPGAFSPLYIALLKAGELSGTLNEILERLSDYLEKSEDVKSKVISTLYYPAIVLLILFASILLLVFVIAPKFNAVYESFGAKLPPLTQLLMDVSQYMVHNVFSGILIMVAIPLSFVLFAMTDRGRNIVDRISLKFPVFGTLYYNSIVARFSRTLGMLMNASVPVLDSFTLVSKVVGNSIVEKAILKAKGEIQEGRTINKSLAKARVFPDILLQLADTGEETGEIDSLLIKCAGYYEKQVDTQVGRITSLIEPLLIVLLALIVGTIVIIIYLPIFYLGTAARQGM